MGGFFSLGKKAPSYPTVAAPNVGTGQNYYNQGMQFGNQNFGQAMGARESALSDLSKGNDYYAGFQPTSFENALATQNFKNIWPDQQAFMRNELSKSGMAYSPVSATTLGNAYGNLGSNIGQYLTNLGNQRATTSLQSRLNIDPMSQIVSPYANLGAQQGNNQANYDWQATKQNADAQYANEMQKYMRQQAELATISKISPVGGFLAGGGEGAAMGASNIMNEVGAAYGMPGMGGNGGQPNMGMGYGSPSNPTGYQPQGMNSYMGGYGSQPNYGGYGGYGNTGMGNYMGGYGGGMSGGGNGIGMGMGNYMGGYGNTAQPVYNNGSWGSGNQPGTGMFGGQFLGSTQGQVLGYPTQQFR